ncbi:hypothetical protein QJS66_23015 [Kocuria rhizophila]|nr:hypothetical protein QJS66_23015 [Kocuria rhizophila]
MLIGFVVGHPAARGHRPGDHERLRGGAAAAVARGQAARRRRGAPSPPWTAPQVDPLPRSLTDDAVATPPRAIWARSEGTCRTLAGVCPWELHRLTGQHDGAGRPSRPWSTLPWST